MAKSESDDPSSLAYASFAGFKSAEAPSAQAEAIQIFHPLVPADAGTQMLDSRFRGNERAIWVISRSLPPD